MYMEPHAGERPSRVDGIYIDLRDVDSVSPAMIVDAMKSCGVDPKEPVGDLEIIALIDPEKPPRGLDLIASLWNLVVALDLKLLKTVETLRIAQEAYRSIAIRIHEGHLQYNLGIIALLVPDITIIPLRARSMARDLKIYAGAAAGRILVETCNQKPLEELLPIIDGMVLVSCS
ncbi:MAG: hypothetical protein DJ555_05700 [Desulfurococcaceae archaeon]|nr:MAG: hypothetical protein DJ555_05700 [Desulfurococcaceae archaeon]